MATCYQNSMVKIVNSLFRYESALQELSAKLRLIRLIRSQISRITTDRAYEQMIRLMGRTISSDS